MASNFIGTVSGTFNSSQGQNILAASLLTNGLTPTNTPININFMPGLVGNLQNSAKAILTQTITGQVTKNAAKVPGALIRADLAQFTLGRNIVAARVNLPVVTGGGKVVVSDLPLQFSQNLSLPFAKGLSSASGDPFLAPDTLEVYLDEAARTGLAAVRGYVNYFSLPGGAAVAFPTSKAADSVALQYALQNPGVSLAPVQSYEIQVQTGAGVYGTITGAGGVSDTNVTGQFVVATVGKRLRFLGLTPSFAMTDQNGNYRLTVGVDSVPGNQALVLMSVLEPGGIDQSGKPIPGKLATYGDPSLANFLPFKPDVNFGTATSTPRIAFTSTANPTGANGLTVQNIAIDQIAATPIKSGTTGLQLLGSAGNINQKATNLGLFQSATFLMGAPPQTAAVSYWYPMQTYTRVYTGTGPDAPHTGSSNNLALDQAQPGPETFTLTAHAFKSDLEFNDYSINIANIGS